MMLEIGHEFKRNKTQFCVIDIIKYNNTNYCLLSEERQNEKIDFHFYEYSVDINGNVDLILVKDEETTSTLYGLMEGRK